MRYDFMLLSPSPFGSRGEGRFAKSRRLVHLAHAGMQNVQLHGI